MRGREKGHLRALVVLHVYEKIKVVGRQIGESAHGETYAVHFAEGERVRGHLHDHGVGAVFEHLREQTMKRGRVGRGQRRFVYLVPQSRAVGAYQSRAPAVRFENGAQYVSGGGLAVRAGHPYHGQFVGRVAVERRGTERERPTHVGHDYARDAFVARGIRNDSDRAARARESGVLISPLAAVQAKIQISVLAYPAVAYAFRFHAVVFFQYVLKTHIGLLTAAIIYLPATLRDA